jgi:hypothetical protein
MPSLIGTAKDAIVIADTAWIPAEVASHLRAPQWHLLCRDTEWLIRCGTATPSKTD